MFLIQTNGYCNNAYNTNAYCTGDDYGEAIARQVYVVIQGQPGYGYCGSQETYCESPWAWARPFAQGFGQQFDYAKLSVQGHQYRMNVENSVGLMPHQFSLSVASGPVVPTQFLVDVQATGVLGTQWLLEPNAAQVLAHQFSLSVAQSPVAFTQFRIEISTNSAGTSPALLTQYILIPTSTQATFQQLTLAPLTTGRTKHQFHLDILSKPVFRTQFKYNSPYIYFEGGYCGGPYAQWQPYPWLPFAQRANYRQFQLRVNTNASGTSGRARHQYELISTRAARTTPHQLYLSLARTKIVGHQFLSSLVPAFDATAVTWHQFQIAQSNQIRHQWRISVYNTTNLRILWEFASDGRTYANISASSEAAGDFQAVNMKSDIVEQVWKATGQTSEWFQVDCGEGYARLFDTIALINHNLTTSAVVRVKGYGGSYDLPPSNWASVPVFATLEMPEGGGEENLYWIAPSVPTESFRYYRVEIEDPTNPNPIQIGRFVGGAALVFQQENFSARFQYAERNFKDEQSINGFTTISNNRALKKLLKITLPSIDAIGKQNFSGLRRYTRYSRDTLKALVIPDPTMPYMYSVFAKLREVPSYDMNYLDGQTQYADIVLEFDEGR
jgi:hypothetical protein